MATYGTIKYLESGLTLVALAMRNGQIWNSGTSAYVDADSLANATAWTALLLSCTELGLTDSTGTGVYQSDADLEAAMPCDVYFWESGAAPGDPAIGVQTLDAAVSTRAVAGDAMALTSDERTALVGAIWGALTSGLTAAGSIGKWLLDTMLLRTTWTDTKAGYVDAAISGIPTNPLLTNDARIPATAPPTNTQFEARTKAAADYATAANQTTILNRLGAWTGTGVNTILGAFKALLSKAATAPSDIGGTFTPETDSVEAIRDTAPLGSAMRGTDGAYTGTPPTVTQIRQEIDDNSTKTGYKLASDGMDSIATTEPSGDVADWNFRQRLVWFVRRLLGKTVKDSDGGTIKVYGSDGTTVLSTQTITETSTTETQGEAT